ncbi:MAG: hypothetical protein R3Y09_08530 [Clostridia bacterium]
MLYIGAAIVVGLLVGLVALAILWLARSVGASIQSKTINLMSEYDELLEQKSRELIKEQAREQTNDEIPVQIIEKSDVNGIETTSIVNVAQRISNTAYRDASVGQIYHKIRQGFVCNTEEIFGKLDVNDEPFEEGIATRLLKVLSFDQVYELCTLAGHTQYEVLMEVMPEEFFIILEGFSKENDKFDSLEFYNYLKDMADLEPKETIVRVAPGADISKFPKGATVIVDNDICEGIQVEKRNTLYDFCIKTREIG